MLQAKRKGEVSKISADSINEAAQKREVANGVLCNNRNHNRNYCSGAGSAGKRVCQGFAGYGDYHFVIAEESEGPDRKSRSKDSFSGKKR